MREVGVHLEHVLGALRQRVAEPRDVGRTEPELARPLEQVDAGIGGLALQDQRAGAVGRVVVDDQHVQPERQRQQLVQQAADVVAFVVGGDDDEVLHRHAFTRRFESSHGTR